MKADYWKMSEYASVNEQLDWKKAKVIEAGVDIGAVSSKAVILLDGQPYAFSQVRTRTPKESAFRAINAALAKTHLKLENIHYIVGTGRGRTQVPFARKTISEIACGAAGAVHIWGPSVRTVLDAGGQIYYQHRPNTAKNTPNLSMNNVRGALSSTVFGYVVVNEPFYQMPKCEESYFEVCQGYPRNHYTHKAMQFSPVRFQNQGKENGEIVFDTYVKSRQTVSSTVGLDGLEDGTLPVQTIETSNVNLVQGDNVINQ